MQSPPSTTTYTTIPISGTDVIFRSIQNLTTFLSHHRPWPEFISGVDSFTVPDSLLRIRSNLTYFAINYGIITTVCAAVSLIANPSTLLLFATVFALWLVLYVFREDPMVVYGYTVNDHVVIGLLVLVTGIVVWIKGFVSSFVIGIAVGGLMSIVHAVFRNHTGVYMDENEAVSQGLISPRVYDL